MTDILRHMTDQIARNISAQRDDMLRQAITERLGRDDWSFREVAERLSYTGRDGFDVYKLDGQPLIQWGPIETVSEGGTIKCTQAFKKL